MRKSQKKFKTKKNTKKIQNQKIPKTQVISPGEEVAKMMIKVKMKKVMTTKARMKMIMMRMLKVMEKKVKMNQRRK